ncbi:hypothetical protein CLV49_1880 [Labedella gwakjiensis]|uniref:Uncharacterized protein n=1 Tax=Labedella gwakjiensis TaxID=390269 RepID=A0A2P8GWC4_9MICO|nr:hypothetical protein [Labedella gwakjiensis]PSL38263.1 hypothetical protein CLV49_1880 [Labedella gwakjiensis]RUQ87199.1 hypothetical protein ELQ93_09820 [Labedella gwakjiensis]
MLTDTIDIHDTIESDAIEFAGISAVDVDFDALWETEQKADRLLCRLPAETIGYLGDDFPWAVTDEDVRIARLALSSERLGAILLGRELARVIDGSRESLAA